MIEWHIIKKVLNDTASADERFEVQEWRKQAASHERFFQNALKFYGKGEVADGLDADEVAQAWARCRRRNRMRPAFSVYMVRTAAMVAVLLGVVWGFWHWSDIKNGSGAWSEHGYEDVTLVLSDGSVHSLADSEETMENIIDKYVQKNGEANTGTEETGAADALAGKCNELFVPARKTFSLVLSDGSKVVVNSQSSLSFPDKFCGAIRRVLLNGEAYFEVARDEHHPFIVSANGVDVKVLGTSFNVRAYGAEDVTASLATGKIALTREGARVCLMPGEECVVDMESGKMNVRDADLASVLAWKNGEFIFKGESLENIMNQFSRWYDVDVEYASEGLKKKVFYMFMSRDKELDEVLGYLSKTGQMSYEINDGTVYIKE